MTRDSNHHSTGRRLRVARQLPCTLATLLVLATLLPGIPARAQEQLATLVPGTRLIVATQSGYYIQIDQPDLAIDAIRTVVEAVRDPTSWATPTAAQEGEVGDDSGTPLEKRRRAFTR